VTRQVEIEPEGKVQSRHILLFIASLLLPSAMWMVLGWMGCLLPLLIFVCVSKYGWRHTTTQLTVALPAAALIGFFLHIFELVLFMAALLPAGYAVAHATIRKQEPWLAGLKEWVTLALTLYLFFSILLIDNDVTVFGAIVESLNHGIDESLKHYSASGMSADNMAMLAQTLNQVKHLAPLILPGILGSILLGIVWLTLVPANALLPALGANSPWNSYRYWQLPEKLVWALIAAGVTAAIPEQPLQIWGINGLMIITALYGFQGLAIAVFLLHKWKVPRFLRTLIYVVILLQSFGTILLVIAGVADVWCDIRRLKKPAVDDTADFE